MTTIYMFPNWSDNPYLNIIGMAPTAAGARVAGGRILEDFERAAKALQPGDVLHVHWTSPVTAPAATEQGCWHRVERFGAAVRTAVARGVRLVWTVHNEIAHGSAYRAMEVRVAEILAEYSEIIFVLNSHTSEAVAESYTLPQGKVRHLPHSSYVGIYPPAPARSSVRRELGIPLGARVLAFLGAIHPYKGIDDLLKAAPLVKRDVPGLILMIGGQASRESVAELDALARECSVRIIREHSFLNDAQMVQWAAAADALVFPYRRILNSGSMMFSSSVGRRCVLPAEHHLVQEFGDEEWISFFDRSGDVAANLAAACARSLSSGPGVEHSARRFAESRSPYAMSVRYLELLGLTESRA